jgi:hypothetical protein
MRLFHPVPPPGHITSPLQVENIPPLKEPGTGHVPPRSFRVLEFCRSRWKTPTRTLRVIADLDRRRLASWPRAGGVRRIGVWPGRVHLLGGRESDILRWRYAPVEHFTLLSLFRCFVFAFFLSFFQSSLSQAGPYSSLQQTAPRGTSVCGDIQRSQRPRRSGLAVVLIEHNNNAGCSEEPAWDFVILAGRASRHPLSLLCPCARNGRWSLQSPPKPHSHRPTCLISRNGK